MNPLQANVLVRLYEGKIHLDFMDRREQVKTERILCALQARGLALMRGSRWACSHEGALLAKAIRAESLAN